MTDAPRSTAPPVSSTEQTALARLEDLGDIAARDRERAVAPSQRRRPPNGAAAHPPPEEPRGSLLRSNLVVGTGTMMSRVTGLVRAVTIAAVLGKGPLFDAFGIGNETPNVVYELLIGGVLSATLVPLFASMLGDGETEEDRHATNVVVTVTASALAALTAVAVLAAPWIFRLYTLNISADVDPSMFRRAGTLLTRLFLLQIFFYGITALMTSILQARRRFFAASWSPVLSNLVIIAAFVSLRGREYTIGDVLTDQRLRLTIGLGTTLGIVLMAVVLLPAARQAGWRFRPAFEPRHPVVRRLITMSAWTLGFVLSNQILGVAVKNLSVPGSGDSGAYLLAFTLLVMPHGLLTMSIATTFAPEMARAAGRRDRSAFIGWSERGVRMIALLTVPAAVALFLYAKTGLSVFLNTETVTPVARALAGFSFGLVGFSVYQFGLRGFYAHHDTRSPFFLNAGQCLLNVVLAFLFTPLWGILGLAAAFSVSYALAAVWVLRTLEYKVPGFPTSALVGTIARMLLAGALAAEVAWFVTRRIDPAGVAGALVHVAVGSITIVVVYTALLTVLKAPELASARALVGRLRRAAPAGQ